MLRVLVFIFCVFPTLLFAQNYPAYTSVYINDYANIIDEDAEARLLAELENLKKETGVEATVLTLQSWKTFGGHDTIESFATGLFNEWGIGNAERNNGILILVAQTDREMRVELGSGYLRGYDIIAGDIIDQRFLPEFRSDNYSQGIENGTYEVIDQIARPHAAGQEPPEQAVRSDRWRFLIPFVVVAGMLFLAFRRKLGDFRMRFRHCPNCGRRGLSRDHEVILAASRTVVGRRRQTTHCRYCDYSDSKEFATSRTSRSGRSGGGSFGGGSSSGGGASGRW